MNADTDIFVGVPYNDDTEENKHIEDKLQKRVSFYESFSCFDCDSLVNRSLLAIINLFARLHRCMIKYIDLESQWKLWCQPTAGSALLK